MNSISVCGRLGRDAELKTSNSGMQVLNFSVADDIGFGDKKKTQWVNCAVFGKRAEALAKYLKKGMAVTCIGEVELREFDKKDGTRGASLSMVCDKVAMQSKVEQQQNQNHEPSFDDNGEIPF